MNSATVRGYLEGYLEKRAEAEISEPGTIFGHLLPGTHAYRAGRASALQAASGEEVSPVLKNPTLSALKYGLVGALPGAAIGGAVAAGIGDDVKYGAAFGAGTGLMLGALITWAVQIKKSREAISEIKPSAALARKALKEPGISAVGAAVQTLVGGKGGSWEKGRVDQLAEVLGKPGSSDAGLLVTNIAPLIPYAGPAVQATGEGVQALHAEELRKALTK